jgi:hypothetical protein
MVRLGEGVQRGHNSQVDLILTNPIKQCKMFISSIV